MLLLVSKHTCVLESNVAYQIGIFEYSQLFFSGWFQTLQDVHLASIIMSVINLLLIGAFIAIYAFAEWRASKRKKPLLSLTMTKTGLALWFVITVILGKDWVQATFLNGEYDKYRFL